MRMNSSILIAAALLVAGPALAQTAAKPAAKPAPATTPPAASAPAGQPSKDQLEDAAFDMRVFVSAMASDKVEGPIKDALFECIYNNNFGKISDGIGKVAAQNPDKVAKRNPEQILGVMASLCGYRPKPAEAGAAPAAPAPAKPATAAPAKPAPAKPGTQQQQGR